MSEQKAYDLGRFQRIVGVEGPRVRGNFIALATADGQTIHVSPIEVKIWDEGHHSGRIIRPDDMTAFVKPDGEVDIPKHMLRENTRYDIEDAWDEMVSAVRLVAQAAQFEWRTTTPGGDS